MMTRPEALAQARKHVTREDDGVAFSTNLFGYHIGTHLYAARRDSDYFAALQKVALALTEQAQECDRYKSDYEEATRRQMAALDSFAELNTRFNEQAQEIERLGGALEVQKAAFQAERDLRMDAERATWEAAIRTFTEHDGEPYDCETIVRMLTNAEDVSIRARAAAPSNVGRAETDAPAHALKAQRPHD